MKFTPLILAVFIASTSASDLQSLGSKFASDLDQIDQDQHSKLAKLDASYRQKLLSLRDDFRSRGDLDGVLAVDDETARPGDQRFAAPLSIKIPALRRLQGIYHQTAAELRAKSERRITARITRQSEALLQLEQELVKKDELEAAKVARAERERLQAELSGKPQSKLAPLSLSGLAERNPVTIAVSSDRLVMPGGRQRTKGLYWIETDNKKGRAELTFVNPDSSIIDRPESVTLRIHIANEVRAESRGKIDILCEQRKVGSFHGAQSNRWIEIELDADRLPTTNEIKLVLVNRSPDGLAISSKSAGLGAELKRTYPRRQHGHRMSKSSRRAR